MIGQMLSKDIDVVRQAYATKIFESAAAFTAGALQLVPPQANPNERWEKVVSSLRHITSVLDLCRGVFVGVDAIETKRQMFSALAPTLFTAARFLHSGGPWVVNPANATQNEHAALLLVPLHPHEFHNSERSLADALRRECAEAAEQEKKLAEGARPVPGVQVRAHLARWGGQLRVCIYSFMAAAVVAGAVAPDDARLSASMTGIEQLKTLRYLPHVSSYVESFLAPVLRTAPAEALPGAPGRAGIIEHILAPFLAVWSPIACDLNASAVAASLVAESPSEAGALQQQRQAQYANLYSPLFTPRGELPQELREVAQRRQEFKFISAIAQIVTALFGRGGKRGRWSVKWPVAAASQSTFGLTVPLPIALCGLAGPVTVAQWVCKILVSGLESGPFVAANSIVYTDAVEKVLRQLPARVRSPQAVEFLVTIFGRATLQAMVKHVAQPTKSKATKIWDGGLNFVLSICEAAGWKGGKPAPASAADWTQAVSKATLELFVQVAAQDRADVSFLHEAMGGRSLGSGGLSALGRSGAAASGSKSGPNRKRRRMVLKAFLMRHGKRIAAQRGLTTVDAQKRGSGAVLDIPMRVVGGFSS